ncbi:bifunctional phosphopantothenoylcysteine decarboxylase/phosphopantothenate--cysteine ligase CoaBC [Nordella sp. HKS 07]|nr:bifunctional phosphopantothenoylcysteine decarboxylase/phosphopantothenate--cysteine ligase CoaBC [Nordella sp. HKS 07]QIG52475.1 bifunctional phosphopantothenoylcysteine decarboxylase/phosphopantothenate--cysteine ligase CoaBC [Nordella sp. HKS 07]
MTNLSGRSVLLIVGGGIAAYKSLELVRLLKQRQAKVTAIMTKAAGQFVTELSLASLTGEKVYTDLFSLTDEVEMGHIQLSRSADLIVVAPASADLMAKMAQGLANDLASTTLLATDKKILIAPAMNVRMWQHPATARNLSLLKADGVRIVGPNDGEMACGEYGPGRMAEPVEILAAIEAFFAGGALPLAGGAATRPLAGRKVIITAGPTHEPIDPVRYIANRSSGKQGYALAEAAVVLGAETILVSGPVHLSIPPGAQMMPVETAADMLKTVEAELPADIAIFAAAVADWRVADTAGQKIKKGQMGSPELKLAENPDILKTVAEARSKRPKLVVGFAAETENVIENAKAKLKRKGCDLIVANDVSAESGVMGGNRNKVHLVSATGVESWPELDKSEVARRLMEDFARRIGAMS